MATNNSTWSRNSARIAALAGALLLIAAGWVSQMGSTAPTATTEVCTVGPAWVGFPDGYTVYTEGVTYTSTMYLQSGVTYNFILSGTSDPRFGIHRITSATLASTQLNNCDKIETVPASTLKHS